jgi:hypothetical protein
MTGKFKADVKTNAYYLLQKEEDDLCERTLKRLREQAEALGTTTEALLEEVIPNTRERLKAYLSRKAQGSSTNRFAKFEG